MFKVILKFSFSLILIYYLLSSGKLDLSLVKKTLDYPEHLLFAIILLLSNVFLTTYRWQQIISVEMTQKINFLKVLSLTWIGLFFNTIIPGAVSGDLIKVLYAKKQDEKVSKTFLLTSVFFDRVIGLCGLIILMGISNLYYYKTLTHISDQVTNLVHFNFLFFLGPFFFLLSLFFPIKIQNFILKVSFSLPGLGKFLGKTLQKLWAIGSSKEVVAKSLGLSLIGQFLNISAFWYLCSPFAKYLTPNSPKLDFFFSFAFFPIGLTTTAIPITPGGMGVGHVLFDTLFSYFSIVNGASLFNLFFLLTVILNLIGVFPYILSGESKKSLSFTTDNNTTVQSLE